jgi:hypothetical protein
MSEKEKYLEQISSIKEMMETNSKFLSLSGLSGVWAGSVALIGAGAASVVLKDNFILYNTWQYLGESTMLSRPILTMLFIGVLIFIVAVGGGFIFTYIKAKKVRQKLFNAVSKQMLAELFFILFVGGALCLIQMYHQVFIFIASTSLIFYGLALFTISRFTVRDIKVLACLEILLGIANAFFIYNGLFFWCLGFGVLHIVYGIILYYKYDKSPQTPQGGLTENRPL